MNAGIKHNVIANYLQDKIPPQAIELERAILGRILIEKDTFLIASTILKSGHFYDTRLQVIYRACETLFNQQKYIDINTVHQYLTDTNKLEIVGGPLALTDLIKNISLPESFEYCCYIIKQKWVAREIIRITNIVQDSAFQENEIDLADTIDLFEREMSELSAEIIGINKIERLDKIAEKSIEELNRRVEFYKKGVIPGITSGLKELDRITCGWQDSDLIIIAARPSVGKTAFLLHFALNACLLANQSVCFFSIEMSKIRLADRAIVILSHIWADSFRTGVVSEKDWIFINNALRKISGKNIFVDDTAGQTIQHIKTVCRLKKKQNECDMIIIDYLQLIKIIRQNKTYNREQEVAQCTRELKELAKELNIPILLLSQMNRMIEMRGKGNRPQLSDLRESGCQEQDADIVMFIHRPEKMGQKTDEKGNDLRGYAELIIAKYRNGPCGIVKLKVNNEISNILDWDSTEGYNPDGFHERENNVFEQKEVEF